MFKGTNINRKKIYLRLLFFGGVIIFVLLFFGLTKEIISRRQIDRQISDYQNQIGELKTENESLSEKILTWNKSGELESNARAKLGLEKPGEHTIIIVRSAVSTSGSVAIKSNQKEIKFDVTKLSDDYQSNPQKWWQYFFK